MDITFTPPLSHETHLFISPIHSTATLIFTASFSSASYAHLICHDAKLQVWTNVYLDTDKPGTAEWRAFDFQIPASPSAGSTDVIEVSLRDDTLALEGDNPSHDSLLSLQLSVPRGCAFSYTYRLVHPTGEIRWLGEYGRNRDGYIVIEQSRTDAKFILHEGWSTQNGRYTWTDNGKSVVSLEVARLSSPSDFSIWSIGRDSFFHAKEAHLACFVPHVSPDCVMPDPTYILSASPDITFTVSSTGVVAASGTGSLLLLAPGSGTKSDIHSYLAHSPSDVCKVTALDTTTENLLLTSGGEGSHPLKAVILPMISRQPMPTWIALNKLSAFLHDDVTQYSIFSPLNMNTHFFTRSTKDSNQEVRFITDPSGGAFILSPVYNLKGRQYQISVLSEYKSIKLETEPDLGNLPTPPPSPRLRPSSPPSPPRETFIPEFIPSDPASSLVQNDCDEDGYTEIQAPAIVDTLLAYFISIAILLFTSLYQLFFGRPGEDINERDKGDREEKYPMMGEQDASAGKSESEPQVTPVTPVAHALVVAQQSRPDQHPKLLSHSLLVETHGGKVRAAFRSADPATPSALLTVELNGRKIDPTFTKLGECISLLEVDGGTGGSLKITVA